MKALLLIALLVGPAFAEETIGVRAGVEEGSTVTLASDPGRRDALLLFGVDGDASVDRYVFGGGLSVSGGPGSYGAMRGGLRGGIGTSATHLRASVEAELGVEWLTHICPFIHSEPCGSDVLPFTGVRGSLGYAFEYVEVGLWTELIIDLGRDHVTSGNAYNIGGHMIGGGVSVAYLHH